MHCDLDISTQHKRVIQLGYGNTTFWIHGHFHLVQKTLMLFNQGRVSEIIAVTLTDGHFIGRSGDSSGEFGEVNSSGDFIHTVVECVFVDADHKTECFLCFSNLLFRDLCIITVIT